MLLLLREIDRAWMGVFQESGFHDIYFSRLFTELWLDPDDGLSKTDAYDLVKEVSRQTAIKYVRRAIEAGYLQEVDNPLDGRSRLLRMTPLLREQFGRVLDRLQEVLRAPATAR